MSDAGENDDAFENNMPKPPVIPPRKSRAKSVTDTKTSERAMRRQNSADEVTPLSAPPRPPKSPHKLNRAATFSSFIRVDLSDAIDNSDSIQTPPPLPPRPQSTSSTLLMSPRRNLPPSENSIHNLNDNEEVPPGLPPRPPKPR